MTHANPFQDYEKAPLYRVLHYPHALLKKPSTLVTQFSAELHHFLNGLLHTMYVFDGGGIAAPQVGVCKQIFMVDFTNTFNQIDGFAKTKDDFLVFNDQGLEVQDYTFPMVFINPQIVETAAPNNTDWEGCLSFPEVPSYKIPRFQHVHIKAQNPWGQWFSVKTHHPYAAVNFLHETDHLAGKMMIHHWPKKDFSEKEVIKIIKDYEISADYKKKMKKHSVINAHDTKWTF